MGSDGISPPRLFPFCIVWSPIPVITWIFPFVGHMGIARSGGVILDFAGPYYISEDSFSFGNPTRYIQLDPSKAPTEMLPRQPLANWWDQFVDDAAGNYRNRMYGFFTDNCHCFVAHFLNSIRYDNKDWNMVVLAAKMFFTGKYVAIMGVLKTWVPFVAVAVLGGYFGRLTFLYVYLSLIGFGIFCFLFSAFICRPLFTRRSSKHDLEM